MRMRRGTRLLPAAAIVALAIPTWPAGAGAAGASSRLADAPPPCESTVVLRVGTGAGGFTPEGPEVTIYSDGRVSFRQVAERASPGESSSKVTTLAITDEGIASILRRARRAGLLNEVDYGEARITDQATTTFEVRDGKRHETVSIYALTLGGAGYGPADMGLTDEQIAARSRAARFAARAVRPKTYQRYERTEAQPVIAHPSGEEDVVLRTETSRNFWGGEYDDAAAFALFGDGRLSYANGKETQLSEADVQTVLCQAEDVGLLTDTDFGDPLVTDQGTTEVEVHAGGFDHTFDLYALELVEGDRGLPPEQREAREALRAFLHSV
jgi:hypothetical protein